MVSILLWVFEDSSSFGVDVGGGESFGVTGFRSHRLFPLCLVVLVSQSVQGQEADRGEEGDILFLRELRAESRTDPQLGGPSMHR